MLHTNFAERLAREIVCDRRRDARLHNWITSFASPTRAQLPLRLKGWLTRVRVTYRPSCCLEGV
jgi:hypothetical protein